MEAVARGYFELPGLKTTLFPNLKHLDIGLRGDNAGLLSRFLVAGLRTLHLTFFDPFPTDEDMDVLLSIATELTELAELSFDLRLRADSCRDSLGLLGRRVSLPRIGGVLYDMRLRWLGSFLVGLPKLSSLVALSIGGCFITDEICAVLPSMTGLRLVDFATLDVVHIPNLPMASLPHGLESVATKRLEKLYVQASSSANPFDMSAVTHFISITHLDLRIGGDTVPIHLGHLSTLPLLEFAAIRFWGIHEILDKNMFSALVAGWPRMRRLLFAVPVEGHMPPLEYALHIQDLVVLGVACPLLESFTAPVETRASRPLPIATHPLHHLTELNFPSSPIDQEDIDAVLRYMEVLFPSVTTLSPGEPAGRWEPIREEIHRRRSTGAGEE